MRQKKKKAAMEVEVATDLEKVLFPLEISKNVSCDVSTTRAKREVPQIQMHIPFYMVDDVIMYSYVRTFQAQRWGNH